MNHSSSTPSPSDGDFASSEVSSSGTPTHQQSGSSRSPHPDGSDHGSKKGGNYAYPTEGAMFFKILVPSIAAGAIIGKGGETIAMLQQDTQTRIKMSKATDFFPGTNERVCVVYGPTPESILQVYDFVSQKIREKPDSVVSKGPAEFDTKQSTERDKQVKILVPNSTAGMIIGKGGNYIKYIKEESGAYVQISQKAKDHAITERCITVIGDQVEARKACGLILSKIFEDPLSNTCPNLSYADVIGPVPNYNPTGSPFANMVHGAGGHHHPNDHHMSYMSNPNHFFSSLRNTLRMSGYSEDATTEIIGAMTTLSHYGILGLGLGLGGLAMNMGYLPQHGGHGINGHSSGHGNDLLAGGFSGSSVGGSLGGAYAEGSSGSPMSSAKTSSLRYNGGQQHDSLDSSYNDNQHLGSDNARTHSGQDYRRVPEQQYLSELDQRGRGRVGRPQHAKFA